MSTWDDLAALRESGHRPAGAVWVLTQRDWNLRQTLAEIGEMVIDHDPAEEVPMGLIAGLDVLLMFGRCGEAEGVAKAMRESAYPPRSCRVWCECGKKLSIVPDRCKP